MRPIRALCSNLLLCSQAVASADVVDMHSVVHSGAGMHGIVTALRAQSLRAQHKSNRRAQAAPLHSGSSCLLLKQPSFFLSGIEVAQRWVDKKGEVWSFSKQGGWRVGGEKGSRYDALTNTDHV